MQRGLWTAGALALAMTTNAEDKGAPVARLMTLDPGHFHAALVQKFMYADIDPTVFVYAPEGDDMKQHLKRIDGFNARTNPPPTRWVQKVHTGPDFAERMFKEKPGNVLVLAGNNAKKTEYIAQAIKNGLHVLADKPMAITPQDLALLRSAMAEASMRNLLLYDIMTERSEITTILQRDLSRVPAVFGTIQKGTPEEPAISKESVHYYSKEVAGVPLKRPQWFFDIRQQGEGIVDVTTHLVDLIQWEVFPDVALSENDVTMLTSKRWPTAITAEQFKKVSGAERFPDYLKPDVDTNGVLQVYCNGAFTYTLRGVHAKVSVIWNFEPPPGSKDTHFSVMRGSRANLVIRQGQEQNFKPILYVEKVCGDADDVFEGKLAAAIDGVQTNWPGVAFKREGQSWKIDVPAKYDIGHEAHFAQVTERFLEYLKAGRLPAWEEPNMITKYATIMKAYEMAHPELRRDSPLH